MRKNLRTGRYNDGTEIPRVTNAGQWSSLQSGAYCYYNNDSTGSYYKGKFYNIYAATDSRGICPTGWHLPSDYEFYLTGHYVDSTILPNNSGTIGTDAGTKLSANGSSGFDALMTGYRDEDGDFEYLGYWTYFWTGTIYNGTTYWTYDILTIRPDVWRYNRSPKLGISVRCLKTKSPDITTGSVTNISATSADYSGTITNDQGAAVTARGICLDLSPNPNISGYHTSNGNGTGTFSGSITAVLSPATTYYLRAYATNSIGTSYGNQVSFTTTIVAPNVTTTGVSSFTSTTAACGGNVTSNGGGAVTAKGVCWSTSSNPTLSDSYTSDGTGSGSFTSSITGLTPGTTYFVRAYATNSAGTSYGNMDNFTTTTMVPIVTTTAVSSITGTTAACGGNITSDGGGFVTEKGVCWSSSPIPTISDSHTSDGTGTGSFTSSITGLAPGTTYYVRAYATNNTGISYGDQLSFTTTIMVPAVTTTAITGITSATATSGGNVTSNGGASVTARGVCWSTSSNPTISNSHTSDGTGTGLFTSSITGLTTVTTYYVRAYATNSVGTSYGAQVSFTTAASVPVVTTNSISSITSTTATGGGNVTSTGGATVTARGVCWSTTSNPTLSNSYTSNGTGTGTFTSSITGLSPGTTYYVRAYATNSAGTAYGTQVSFTSALSAPTVTTSSISNITSTTATGGGNVTSGGGTTVTAFGVCWSTSSSPTISNSHTTDGTGTGSFTSSITGLTPGTTYYVRAYATNSVGTSYGSQISFSAAATVPVVTTAAISSITSTTAIGGGNVTSSGGVSVTTKGVCWSTTSNPTLANSYINSASGTGSYTSSISGLTPGTLYYVRAFATNSAGTAYGDQVTFTTLTIPVVTTGTLSNIGSTSASTGGNVINDCGSSVTARGVCWSSTQGPTVASSHTSDGTGTGAFTSSISGLTAETTYYVRAYATNSIGTSYGDQLSFTTLTTPTVSTSTVSNIGITSATGGGNVTSDGGNCSYSVWSVLEHIFNPNRFKFTYQRWYRYRIICKQYHRVGFWDNILCKGLCDKQCGNILWRSTFVYYTDDTNSVNEHSK